MAKIAIIVEYQPNLAHYPDCETIEDCVAFDVEALNSGEMYPGEFVDNYEYVARAVLEYVYNILNRYIIGGKNAAELELGRIQEIRQVLANAGAVTERELLQAIYQIAYP